MQFITRYFDGIVAPLFKRLADGQLLYFPAGALSRGRLLPDAETEARLRRKIRLVYIMLFALIIPLAVVGGAVFRHIDLSPTLQMVLTPALCIAVGLGFNAYLFSLARGLPKTGERLTFGEAYRAQSRAMGKPWIVALALVAFTFVVSGIAIAIIDPARYLWIGLATAVGFGLCLVIFGKQLAMLGNGKDAGAKRSR